MAHIHDLIDFTVVVFAVYKKKVLLIFHKELQKWLPLGGHIELDENPEQALFRETKEESGLEIELLGRKSPPRFKGRKILHTPSYLDIHDINEKHRHIALVYFAKAKSGKVKLAPEEHEQIRWFSKAELDDSFYKIQPDIKFYAGEALKIASRP